MTKPTPSKKRTQKKTYVDSSCEIESIKDILLSLLRQCTITFDAYSETDYLKDSSEVVTRLKNEGVSFATRTLPRLAEGLFEYLEYGCGNYQGFALVASKYPFFLKRLFRLVYKKHPNVDAIAMIYQFSVAFKKLKGPYRNEELSSQLREFIDVDKELSHIKYGEAENLILDHARMFITELFSDVQEDPNIFYENVIPRPGPGATNTKRPHELRFKPAKIYKRVDEIFPVYDWFYHSYNQMAWDIPHLRNLYKDVVDESTSRFKFVDKVVGKARGICIEENEVQFMQQGVKNFLYKWIETHPLTAGKINFSDQSINASLALKSSFSKEHATLDMKEASDRIPRNLVYELFKDVPILCDALMGLSTRIISFPIEFGIEPINTFKYAPMGSGLCFPIMSLTHYALIKAILHLSMHSDDSIDDIFVYGDDIIVKSETAQAVFDWLPRFGMKFNVKKSFVKSHFRESCGTHAYNGVDITPVYFKYTTVLSDAPTVLQSLISNEYDLWKKGYWTVCADLRQKCRVDRYVSVSCNAVGWKRPPIIPYNYGGTKTRYCQAYHTILHRVICFTAKDQELYDFDDDTALTRWYNLKANAHTKQRRDGIQKYAVRWMSKWQLVC